MKTVLSFFLFLIVTLAFNAEALQYCVKSIDHAAFAVLDDFPADENEPDTEKEKEEKSASAFSFQWCKPQPSGHTHVGALYAAQHQHDLLAGFGQQVYSPPEAV